MVINWALHEQKRWGVMDGDYGIAPFVSACTKIRGCRGSNLNKSLSVKVIIIRRVEHKQLRSNQCLMRPYSVCGSLLPPSSPGFISEGTQRWDILLYNVASLCWGFHLWPAVLRSHKNISIRLSSGLLLGYCNTLIIFFISNSVADLLLYLESLSHCMTKFRPSFSCQTDVLTFDSRPLWYRGGVCVSLAGMFFLEVRGFLLVVVPNKQHLSSRLYSFFKNFNI